MKKIWLLALAGGLTMGAMAKDIKHNKRKCKNCTQKVCTPVCKDKTDCAKMHCNQD